MVSGKGIAALALAAAGIFFPQVWTSAAVQVTGGCGYGQTALTLMRPLPDQAWKGGDEISFTGRVWQSVGLAKTAKCGKIVFYMGGDSDAQVADCCGRPKNACTDSAACTQNPLCKAMSRNAYGALTTPGCTGIMSYPNDTQVKYLSAAGQQLVKIGEINLPATTVPGNNGNAEAFFDSTFTVPEDTGLSGPVRFYVQYSGIGAGSSGISEWQWLIAYQKGILDKSEISAGGPRVVPGGSTQPDYCTTFSGPAAILSWSLAGGVKQGAYRVQIDDSPYFNPPLLDSGRIQSSVGSFATVAGKLAYGTNYRWRVKVWDNGGAESQWSDVGTFYTPKHAYPKADFTWLPKAPTLNEKVTFSDESKQYGDPNGVRRQWSFQGGNPETSDLSNIKVTFVERGVKRIRLDVTDSDGYSCGYERVIQVNASYPEFVD